MYYNSLKKVPELPKNKYFVNRRAQISLDFLLAYFMKAVVIFKILSVKID